MYVPFFGLKQKPFSIAPDPRYLFMSERHREALAHLLYGVHGGGDVAERPVVAAGRGRRAVPDDALISRACQFLPEWDDRRWAQPSLRR